MLPTRTSFATHNTLSNSHRYREFVKTAKRVTDIAYEPFASNALGACRNEIEAQSVYKLVQRMSRPG